MYHKDTISKRFKYKPLRPYIGLEGRVPIRNKDVYVGVEVELEGVQGYTTCGTSMFVEDNSLKLDGAEFVTIPIKMRYLEVELDRLFSGLSQEPTISSRCSTHVHMNVRDMTVDEVLNLVMLYMIFERSLYRASGDRWDSNFCVPLGMDLEKAKSLFYRWDNITYWGWHKYLGLNISPIFGGESNRIGTVEFRQMKGSTSTKEIIDWCNLITSLKRAAQRVPQDELLAHIRTMNTTSGYGWLAKEVFGPYRRSLITQPTFDKDVEWCIGNLKNVLPDKRLGYTMTKNTKCPITFTDTWEL